MTKKPRRPLWTGKLIGRYFKFYEDQWEEFTALADANGDEYSTVMRDAVDDYIRTHGPTQS